MARVKTMRACMMLSIALTAALIGTPGCSGSTSSSPQADLSQASPEDQMFAAASAGDTGKLKALLDTDKTLVDALALQSSNRTPLHFAAANGRDAAVELLLQNGAEPSVEDENGESPIDAAMLGGHRGTANLMIEAVKKRNAAPAQ